MKRRISRSLLVLTLALPFAIPAGVANAQLEPTVEWISEDSGETGGRELPAVSADGRFVVFVGRSEVDQGVYVRDRVMDTTHRVTSGSHFNPAISADGRVVAYAQFGGSARGIYVLDWQDAEAQPELVSVGDDGQSAGVPTDFPALSGDGRYVAFQAFSDSLDDAYSGGASGGPSKIYVRDRQLGDTEMVSVTTEGEIANGNANRPDITPDGTYVVFTSDAGNLAGAEGEEAEAAVHVYRHNRTTGVTRIVSVSDGGTPGDASSGTVYGPTISDDGQKVAFESDATNLVDDDTNDNTDAFVRDISAGTTIRVSLDADGDQATLLNATVEEGDEPEEEEGGGGGAPPEEGESVDATSNAGAGPAISGDGTHVAFESDAALTADDQNTPDPVETFTTEGGSEVPIYTTDVYLRNLSDGTLVRASAATGDGVEATGLRTDGVGATSPANNGVDPAIDADGNVVAFVSNGNLSGERPPAEEEETDEPEEGGGPPEGSGPSGALAQEDEEASLWEPGVWAYENPAAAATTVERTSGPTRIETAIALSELGFPGGSDTVLLARSDAYPDALAGAPLAAALDAPILLTTSDQLLDVVADEIDRLGATEAILLGGEAALSPAVEAALGPLGVGAVSRAAGPTRFETATEIASRVVDLTDADHVFVVEGIDEDPARGWPDAVSVSALAAFRGDPILLVSTEELPAATATALEELEFGEATVVGGQVAVSPDVKNAVEGIVGPTGRLFGATRFGTSAAVADAALAAGASQATTWVATGLDYPDSLVAGPVAAQQGGVLLLIDGGGLAGSPETRDWLTTQAAEIGLVRIVGGTAAVSTGTAGELEAIVGQ